jgi:FixJ family two-component response regulator
MRASAARAHSNGRRLRFDRLKPRERSVLSHVLCGRRNKRIAADLGIDERSVKRHRTNLMAKLQLRSMAELALLAAEAGFNPYGNSEQRGNIRLCP